jgi:predicted DNA-binding antitoxin AbrB/MazE fold protein
MTYHATVKNGTLVLEEPLGLPEGSRVEVEVRSSSVSNSVADDESIPTLSEQLSSLIGKAPGLPADHYLYGRN